MAEEVLDTRTYVVFVSQDDYLKEYVKRLRDSSKSRLMRQILDEWIAAHPLPDGAGE